jgi:hypothetical protein
MIVFGAGACAAPEEEAVGQSRSQTQTMTEGDLASEIDARVAPCFQADWSSVPFREGKDASYDTGGLLGPVRRMTELIKDGSQAVSRLLFQDEEGARVLTAIRDRMRVQADAQGLSDYERVMFAGCVSSRAIEYSKGKLLRFRDAGTILAAQKGECTEFSTIAKSLMKGLGVSADEASTSTHEFVEVELKDGPRRGKYFIEPQRDPRTPRDYFLNPHGSFVAHVFTEHVTIGDHVTGATIPMTFTGTKASFFGDDPVAIARLAADAGGAPRPHRIGIELDLQSRCNANELFTTYAHRPQASLWHDGGCSSGAKCEGDAVETSLERSPPKCSGREREIIVLATWRVWQLGEGGDEIEIASFTRSID